MICEPVQILSLFNDTHGRKASKTSVSWSGADLGFSRGGGGGGADFRKIFQNFDDLFFFFRSTKLIFRALPKHCFAPTLAKFCAPQANF